MPRYGEYKRPKPAMVVKRGWDPNNPTTNTTAVRVKSGVTIKSGQVISLSKNNSDNVMEWELGWSAGRQIFFAQDDSSAYDVVSAGKLVGLSSLGGFELQLAYLKSGETFNVDTPVSPDGTTGDLKATTLESGDPICGFVTVPVTDLLADVNGYPQISAVDSGSVLCIRTAYLPNTGDAT